MTTLQDELRQRKPFGSAAQEAFLSLVRTETALRAGLEQVLGPHGLSLAQYNVLRILRGAGREGVCRNDIRDRLVSRMPDVSRLLDRMEAAGLVRRVRSTEDRRQVTTTLTPRGRALVDQLDPLVAAEHQRRLGHLSERQLRTLIDLLAQIRAQA